MTFDALGYGWLAFSVFCLVAKPAIGLSGCRIPIGGRMALAAVFLPSSDPALFFKAEIWKGTPLFQHAETITPPPQGWTPSELPVIRAFNNICCMGTGRIEKDDHKQYGQNYYAGL
jgi:hypothetical protein